MWKEKLVCEMTKFDEPITIIVSMEQSARKKRRPKDWSHFQSNPLSELLLFRQAWRCLEVHLSLYIIVCHFSQLLTLTQHKIALTPLERSLELSAAVFPSFVAIFFAEVSKAQVSEAFGRSEVEASVDRGVKHWAEPCLANPLCISHIVHPYLSYGARLRWRLFSFFRIVTFQFWRRREFSCTLPTSPVEIMAMLVYQLKQDFAISKMTVRGTMVRSEVWNSWCFCLGS